MDRAPEQGAASFGGVDLPRVKAVGNISVIAQIHPPVVVPDPAAFFLMFPVAGHVDVALSKRHAESMYMTDII